MFYNRKVAFSTLGCKLNYSETSAIARALTEQGYERVGFSDRADFYVVNTCSVTENADRQTRQVVRAALRTNPEAKVIIIGCYAQLKPQEIASIPGVSMVLGANEKFRLHEHLEKLGSETSAVVLNGSIQDVNSFFPAWSFGERTRTFLKVQDGCDYHCSFCTIPLARGRSRSNSIANTVREARKAAATGVQEIVLTGVNIGDFGRLPDGSERTGEDFLMLLRKLAEVTEVPRWRISSIEPNLLTNDIIRFVADSEVFMPHFHIPLQCGSDRILKYMRRRYLTALYRERIETIRQVLPEACIGADVIAGFPGETGQDFMATCDFIHSLDLSYLHVFTYSERADTRALELSPVVPLPERKRRNEMLRILSEKKKEAFYRRNLGTVRPVLWESENDEGRMYGFTDNYIKVATAFEERLTGTIRAVRLAEIARTGEVGVQLKDEPAEIAL